MILRRNRVSLAVEPVAFFFEYARPLYLPNLIPCAAWIVLQEPRDRRFPSTRDRCLMLSRCPNVRLPLPHGQITFAIHRLKSQPYRGGCRHSLQEISNCQCLPFSWLPN